MMLNQYKNLDHYNEEVRRFFTNIFNIDKEEKASVQRVLDHYKLNLKLMLVPEDYDILLKLFPHTMKRLTNGCKPSYLPKWLKVNNCLKRKKKCNLHDFCYWISWPRGASDKLFIKGMNKVCKGFGAKFKNYRFYYAVRTFGATAYSEESKTLEDFFRLGATT